MNLNIFSLRSPQLIGREESVGGQLNLVRRVRKCVEIEGWKGIRQDVLRNVSLESAVLGEARFSGSLQYTINNNNVFTVVNNTTFLDFGNFSIDW